MKLRFEDELELVTIEQAIKRNRTGDREDAIDDALAVALDLSQRMGDRRMAMRAAVVLSRVIEPGIAHLPGRDLLTVVSPRWRRLLAGVPDQS